MYNAARCASWTLPRMPAAIRNRPALNAHAAHVRAAVKRAMPIQLMAHAFSPLPCPDEGLAVMVPRAAVHTRAKVHDNRNNALRKREKRQVYQNRTRTIPRGPFIHGIIFLSKRDAQSHRLITTSKETKTCRRCRAS